MYMDNERPDGKGGMGIPLTIPHTFGGVQHIL